MPYERIWDDEPGSRWVDTGAAYRDHDADYMQAESEREIMASAFVSDEEFDADPVNSGADIVDDGDDNRMLPEEHSQVTGWDSRPLPPRRNRAPHAAHLRSKPGISSALAASKSSPPCDTRTRKSSAPHSRPAPISRAGKCRQSRTTTSRQPTCWMRWTLLTRPGMIGRAIRMGDEPWSCMPS